MRKKFLLPIFLTVSIITLSPFCFSGQEKSDKVTFSDLIATSSQTHLILFGVLNNTLTDEMISGLRSGIPVEFSFFVELYQKERQTDNLLLTNMQFQHTMTYDILKDSYRVELGETQNNPSLFASLSAAERTMNEINGVKVIPLEKLTANQTYQLRIRADLFKKTLPLSLHRILPFFSWWDKTAEWHSIEFTY